MVNSTGLTPFETLLEAQGDGFIPLPPELERIYGPLVFPSHSGRPYVITNFVSTIDGVVTLATPGHESGKDISGGNPHDSALMGILRASADVVVITAGSLWVSGQHLWTGDDIYPALSSAYEELREKRGKRQPAAHIVVTATGAINLSLPVFISGKVQVLIITTKMGAEHIGSDLPEWVQVAVVKDSGWIHAATILEQIQEYFPSQLILVEAGPHMVAQFLGEACLDELFLTLSPQVAGRDALSERLGFVAGRNFAPEKPLWSDLASIKRAGEFLFLRYRFERVEE